MELEFRNAKWNDAEHTTFDVEMNHPVYGWLPFTATPNDPEEFGRNVFASGLNGDLPVSEYVPTANQQEV